MADIKTATEPFPFGVNYMNPSLPFRLKVSKDKEK